MIPIPDVVELQAEMICQVRPRKHIQGPPV